MGARRLPLLPLLLLAVLSCGPPLPAGASEQVAFVLKGPCDPSSFASRAREARRHVRQQGGLESLQTDLCRSHPALVAVTKKPGTGPCIDKPPAPNWERGTYFVVRRAPGEFQGARVCIPAHQIKRAAPRV